jgi:hypothetical protein
LSGRVSERRWRGSLASTISSLSVAPEKSGIVELFVDGKWRGRRRECKGHVDLNGVVRGRGMGEVSVVAVEGTGRGASAVAPTLARAVL